MAGFGMFGGGALHGPGGMPREESLAEMPAELSRFIESLEEWARVNEKDARRDSQRFWLLKSPAIVLAAASGVVAIMHVPALLVAVMSAATTVFVTLDGIIKPGKLRGIHVMAFHDIRNLENAIASEWSEGVLRRKDLQSLAAEIIKHAETRRKAIAENLKKEEGKGL